MQNQFYVNAEVSTRYFRIYPINPTPLLPLLKQHPINPTRGTAEKKGIRFPVVDGIAPFAGGQQANPGAGL